MAGSDSAKRGRDVSTEAGLSGADGGAGGEPCAWLFKAQACVRRVGAGAARRPCVRRGGLVRRGRECHSSRLRTDLFTAPTSPSCSQLQTCRRHERVAVTCGEAVLGGGSASLARCGVHAPAAPLPANPDPRGKSGLRGVAASGCLCGAARAAGHSDCDRVSPAAVARPAGAAWPTKRDCHRPRSAVTLLGEHTCAAHAARRATAPPFWRRHLLDACAPQSAAPDPAPGLPCGRGRFACTQLLTRHSCVSCRRNVQVVKLRRPRHLMGTDDTAVSQCSTP